ncbi:MAG: nucleotidyl transferase AbiEii/AbiGii toxin family protein [Erysipelotrichaceae bacterium]|jgi:hypothetical protein|nr:nucleotidyl transferase AbiEii/AbiGii toxin family protein [Erysipelotrichaceae bacterium]
MRLCDNRPLFQIIIARASRENGISEAYIEKDYYAISLLKKLISKNNNLVFKGGTSLSVCHHIINRFSEDIDISYDGETITTSERKKIKYNVFLPSINDTGLKLINADTIRSRRIFNRYLCEYESISGTSGTVIAEWATQTPSFPVEVKTAQTIIGKYLDSIGRQDLVELYELGPFETKTLKKERTLVDKIFAICDYHISGLLARQSRHIYDIHQLLPLVPLDDNFLQLFEKVKEYRLNIETCYSAKSDKSISELLLELIEQKTFLGDYVQMTYPLLYDRLQYEECIPPLKEIAMFLKEKGL